MKTLVAFLLMLFGGFLNPCIAGGPSGAVEKLQWLNNADPIQDAHAAVAKGDNRLKAVAGLTIEIPGIPPHQDDIYSSRYGISVISGTSDSLESEEHARLNHLARKYAEQYNREVLKSVQK